MRIAAEKVPELFGLEPSTHCYALSVILDCQKGVIHFLWSRRPASENVVELRVFCTGVSELTWEWRGHQIPSKRSTRATSSHHLSSIRAKLRYFQKLFAVPDKAIRIGLIQADTSKKPSRNNRQAVPLRIDGPPWDWLAQEIQDMAQQLGPAFNPLRRLVAEPGFSEVEKVLRREERQNVRAEQEAAARHAQKLERDQLRARKAARHAEIAQQKESKAPARSNPPQEQRRPLSVPTVPLNIHLPELQFQETLLSDTDLRSYQLIERAAVWWVSNQSDDLLALPYCHIQKLDYQIRTALRVLGPFRGRALLSDEVGLGKTIEAGLVIKEYLTRGMIKRFLVLTVPSLVDQWEEELQEKFDLPTATTNQAAFRADPSGFWAKQNAIVASLHTLKQPAHLASAQNIGWDMLVVDEAHYLRNRTSQAWQAVNALPRQFLLLLTATPVQNSLEELHNLVTLLQPGQLPSPKEFRERFVDKESPHKPREPDELRRLLSQVMIRNTRANAGIKLPPRQAESILFEAEGSEREFWHKWDNELRVALAQLNPSQSSLWGRLLLQTAGSSPAAWRQALGSFPQTDASKKWVETAPLEQSWARKCDLLIPLTKSEGGVVVFSQFLETQATVADRLTASGIPTFVINGQTPAPQRQPITEEFRRRGGALLLTHSGTEGRNLQFCHQLVNFDLPWNPMEIEQRIGRLHRIGQQYPVRIYNLVQLGTLQEHLLTILQDKLNLFELVVGEAGLILGDRLGSDEFAEEVFRRWRDATDGVAASLQSLGVELAAARANFAEIKQLDETLFAKDYESL